MGYGLWHAAEAARWALGCATIAIVGVLLIGARRMVALSRTLPKPDAASRSAGRRVQALFWINLVAEIVLLNVAVALLAKPPLQIYWIPAISLVVGLHFLPMALFFGVRSYVACGSAMIALAAATALALSASVDVPERLVAIEAIGNALILWASAAWGLRMTSRRRATKQASSSSF